MRTRLRTRLLPALALALLLGVASTVAGAETGDSRLQPVLGLQPTKRGESSSLNWGGYAVYGTDMTFNDVSGSWTQPEVASCTKKTQLTAFFVGIDGYNSGSVEQIGTDADCQFGQAVHYAWYEMYPAPVVYIDRTTYPVAPGDKLTANVHYNSGTDDFTLTLDNDNGSGEHSTWHFTQTVSAPVETARTSAQWIAEMPGTGGHFWPLTNFGSVTFSGASVTNDASQSGDIDDGPWSNDKITLVKRGRGQTLACTSSLASGGSSFTVTYGSC